MPRAPRRCPYPACESRIPGGGSVRYCPAHTQYGWTGRSHASGAEHARWAKAVKQRDRTCQLRYQGCTGAADEADHIVNVKAGGARYDLSNGQAACTPCHKTKTQQEARKARAARSILRATTPTQIKANT